MIHSLVRSGKTKDRGEGRGILSNKLHINILAAVCVCVCARACTRMHCMFIMEAEGTGKEVSLS